MIRAFAITAAAIFAAACGGSTSPGVAVTSPLRSPVASSSQPSSPSPSGLTFQLTGINTSAAGTILLTPGAATTTLELMIKGLPAGSSHLSEIRSGSCQQLGGPLYALTQVVADTTGAADATTEVHATYPPASGHWYVVVHAGADMQGTNAAYLLCGNLF